MQKLTKAVKIFCTSLKKIITRFWFPCLTKHTNSMKWHHARRRGLITFTLDGIVFELNHLGNFGVAWETQQHLIEDIFKYEILIIIRRSQLDIFEHQFIDNVIGGQHIGLQTIPMFNVLKRDKISKLYIFLYFQLFQKFLQNC